MEDIQNKAEYSMSSKGVAYNHYSGYDTMNSKEKNKVYNQKGFIPELSPDAKDKATSMAKSAISDGALSVRDTSVDVSKINREVTDSLHKLGQIFDKQKIEERQALSSYVAKEAYKQLHYWNPTTKEGKAAKAVAHGIVGEVASRIAGNSAGSGFGASMTNEAILQGIGDIAKSDPAVAQWVSAVIGASVNKALGKSSNTGAMVAHYGTKWNWGSGIEDINLGSAEADENAQTWLNYTAVKAQLEEAKRDLEDESTEDLYGNQALAVTKTTSFQLGPVPATYSHSYSKDKGGIYYVGNGISFGMSAVPSSYEKMYTYEAMGRVSIKGQSLNAGINLFGSYSLGVSRDGVSSSVGISTTPGVSISYMDSYTTSDELEKYEFTNGEGYRINNATYDYNQKGGYLLA